MEEARIINPENNQRSQENAPYWRRETDWNKKLEQGEFSTTPNDEAAIRALLSDDLYQAFLDTVYEDGKNPKPLRTIRKPLSPDSHYYLDITLIPLHLNSSDCFQNWNQAYQINFTIETVKTEDGNEQAVKTLPIQPGEASLIFGIQNVNHILKLAYDKTSKEKLIKFLNMHTKILPEIKNQIAELFNPTEKKTPKLLHCIAAESLVHEDEQPCIQSIIKHPDVLTYSNKQPISICLNPRKNFSLQITLKENPHPTWDYGYSLEVKHSSKRTTKFNRISKNLPTMFKKLSINQPDHAEKTDSQQTEDRFTLQFGIKIEQSIDNTNPKYRLVYDVNNKKNLIAFLGQHIQIKSERKMLLRLINSVILTYTNEQHRSINLSNSDENTILSQ